MVIYLCFLGLLALERLAELALSRRNARRAFARGAVEVGQKHYRVMAAFHTLFLAACAGEAFFHRDAQVPAWLGGTALVGALLAQALRYWAISTLGERWNVRVIVLPGAAPVVAGPYRFIRHPNYLAVAAEMLCVPLIHGAFLLAAVFSLGNAALLLVRIRAEEAALGHGYSSAFAATPRFLPGGKS
jgi:methyltransferase